MEQERFPFRGLIAGGIVVLGAAIAWFVLSPSEEMRQDAASTKLRLIKEAKFTAGRKNIDAEQMTTNRLSIASKNISEPTLGRENPIVRRKIEGRLLQWKNLRGTPVFTNRFEAVVCEILTATPGERFLDFDLEDSFDKAFEESLLRPVVINHEDSAGVREMKQVVIDAKEEVRRLVSQGESAREIVENARKELNKIADFRDQVQSAYEDYLITAKDAADVIKFAKEANELLAEHGALPINAPDAHEDVDLAYEEMIRARKNKLRALDRKDGND